MNAGYQASTLLVVLFVAVSSLFGESSGDAEPARQTPHGAAGFAERQGIPCYQGSVTLGAAEGAIDYQVRCKPVEPTEKVGFVLSSRLRDEEGPLPLKSFEKHPTVLDPEKGARRGLCLKPRNDLPGTLMCRVRAARSVLVEGRIWVGRGRACQADVTLTPKMPPCRGNCALDYAVITLAQGPPRGC